MSYDFSLYAPVSGLSPGEVMNKVEANFSELYAKKMKLAWTDLGRKRVDFVSRELVDYDPKLQCFSNSDYFEFTRHSLTDEGYIQISLNETGGGIGIGYASSKKKAEPRVYFQEIWGYLTVLQQSGGYHIRDNQADIFLNPATDFEEAYSCYNASSTQVNDSFDKLK